MILLVTVGSTNFDCLIYAILHSEFLNDLKNVGFDKIVLQYGNKINYKDLSNKLESFGEFEKIKITQIITKFVLKDFGVEIEIFSYIDTISSYLQMSDLIISHSGAGTIMECLRIKKKIIACVNNDLMDNHQLEFAQQLDIEQYLHFCSNFENLIQSVKFCLNSKFKAFPQ
ncbi:hypothetical protein A3Q56_05941, partial [Intoshia linei]